MPRRIAQVTNCHEDGPRTFVDAALMKEKVRGALVKALLTSDEVEGFSGGGTTSSSGSKVFVGNLPYSVSWQELKDHMRAAGDVVLASPSAATRVAFNQHAAEANKSAALLRQPSALPRTCRASSPEEIRRTTSLLQACRARPLRNLAARSSNTTVV